MVAISNEWLASRNISNMRSVRLMTENYCFTSGPHSFTHKNTQTHRLYSIHSMAIDCEWAVCNNFKNHFQDSLGDNLIHSYIAVASAQRV